MVASSHRLDELGARHVGGQQHHPHHHQQPAPPAQHGKSAQDKRSRLSSVINNLRHKKVAEEGQQHGRRAPQEPASAAAAAAHGSGVGRDLATLETYVMTVLSGVIDAEEAKPSAKEQEAREQPAAVKGDAFSAPEAEPAAANGSQLDSGAAPEDEAPPAEEAAAPRSLGAIILERLTEAKRPDPDAELREVCRELLDDLLGELLAGLEDGTAAGEAGRDRASPDPATQSLHCSLPLDKVASVLPSAVAGPEAPEPAKPAKPASPTVRHLCLYCDRKFLSISLRQRHTERVHQASGGRRSERNSRKPGQQSCQYCVDQCPGNLEGLFRHMVGSHSDKYHGCLQCCTRYLTRDALASHIHEQHGAGPEKQRQPSPAREAKQQQQQQQQPAEAATVKEEAKPSPAASPEFDTSFYSSVSCNIRENLLHHIDGKLQAAEGAPAALAAASPEAGGRTPQYQLPIDISLTAVTPVYSRDYPTGPEDYKNSSEYAGKPGKSCSRAHPRRVSFEKYNFPRKYDGKEQWNCTLKDLSKFDISTQLTLRKKQRLAKGQLASPTPQPEAEAPLDIKQEEAGPPATVFSSEFESFMRLKKRSAARAADGKKDAGPVCSPAELTGEWSRPRVYICGACAERYITLKELEEHKSTVHPNVWCMHFEFSGDQRELYKHLVFLPGRCASPALSVKTRQQTGASQQPAERVCTKCAKSCASLAELHRHMLECGGDQAWLLGLFGNGKKKCKWRPFGSRSRRRRQRGMKRNIQNSQTPRNAQPRERPQHTGPRVRPSDRESIQKMLANLPAKRATRKVLQENAARSQGRLRNAQSRAGAAGNPASRMVKNKAVLRNKLLKNAKSFQRKKNLREDKSRAAAASSSSTSSSSESGAAPAPAGVGRPRKLLTSRGAWLLAGKKREDPEAQPERKLRGAAPEAKRPVGRPKSTTDADPEQAADKRRRRLEAAGGSLSASLKARLQLRTNDGKFARVAEKKKSLPLDGKSVKIGRRPLSDPARLLTRSKLRAAAKLAWKEHTRISRRVTRLRSLDEKQKQQPQEEEEDEEGAPASEEPGPAPRGRPPRGASRNSSLSSKSLDDAEEKPVERASPAVRGRRPKKVDEAKATSTEEQTAKAQPEAELKTRSQKAQSAGTATPAKLETKTRRSAAAKEAPTESSKKNARSEVDASPSPANKEEKEKVRSTTRSNSRIKRDAREKSETVEDKKATGSKDNNEKKLSKRGQKVAENAEQQTDVAAKKEKSGVLRKSPRNKEGDAKEVSDEAGAATAEKTEEPRSEKASGKDVTEAVTAESNGPTETALKEEMKESKVEVVSETVPKKTVPGKRGRGRTKRVVETIKAPKLSEVPIIELSKISEPAVVEATESNDASTVEPPKSIDASAVEPPKSIDAPPVKPPKSIDAPPVEPSKSIDAPAVEPPKPIDAPAVEPSKPIDTPAVEAPKPCEAPAIEPSEPTEAPAIESSKPSEAPLIEKRRELEPSEAPAIELSKSTEAPCIDTESPKIEEPTSAEESIVTETEKTDEVSTEANVQDDTMPTSASASLPNLSLEHLQLESSNSNMDSGKENSAESLVNASKLKVVRPKKARGARKDGKTSGKRSLNSVIGILTEGVNVPAESAQETSIVLTVQTNPEPESNNQENPRSNDEQLSAENSSEAVVEANNKVTVETSDAIAIADEPAQESKQASEVEPAEFKPKEESKPEVQANIEIVKESEKAVPTPIPEKKEEEEAKPIAVTVHKPANDLILDLSRRKPKGKGSFLEKIVSKIAKQKDVSLDGDSACPFDIVHNSAECQKKTEVVESIKTQECNSTKKAEEIKVESLLDKEASVKLNESTMVNIVNSAESTTILDKKVQEDVVDTLSKDEKISDTKVTEEVLVVAAAVHVETAISENKSETKDILNGAIETVEIEKPLIVDVEVSNQNVEEKIIQEESKEESIEEQVDVPEKKEEMEMLENKEEKLEAEQQQKQKSKKRSLESSSPKKNKKKPVDNEEADEEEEDKEELCLADIMKLIDRPKSKEAQNESSVDFEQEAVKPGKRKSPDDEIDPDSANVSFDDSADQKKETTRKSKRKGAQKKNKREVAKVESETDTAKDIESSDKINVSLEKPIKDNVELKVANENEEIATQKESAITIGPITRPVDEAKTLDTEQIDAPITESANVNEISDEKLPEEKIEETKVDLSSSTPKDNEKEQKTSKRRKRSSKKNTEVSEIPELTDKSPTNVDEESFKVPEMTEVVKPSKKRVSRRKHNRSTISDQELERDEDDIPDEKSDLGSDVAFDQNSSMSESEDRATPKRTSRRTTRNTRLLLDLVDSLIKESDDSDVSSANEMETSRRRRSQRKNAAAEISRDLSENSIDESASAVESKGETKTEKKRKPGRKPKKSAPLAPEVLESTNDSEVPVEAENEIIKKTDTEEMPTEKIEESVNEVEEQLIPKETTIEQKLENEQEQIAPVESTEKITSVEEKSVALVESVREEDKVQEIEKSDEKPACTPESQESQSSSLEESPEDLDDKQQLQEASASELEESGNLEPQVPKKRPVGNFAIVTKSGKILIVEKKKKLTKEAAKFFCDVCATSFTRKSSLKKHNLSQSHILQMTMSGDKDAAKMIQQAKDAEKMENDGEKDSVETEEEEEDSQHSTPRPAVSCEIGAEEKLLTADDSRSRIVDSVSPHSLIIPEPLFAHRSPQEQLEDEMLDEEICKITENMSHDEYVLTDHVSPVTPEAASTPAKQVVAPVVEIQPEPEAKIAPKKKRKEKRKKNLADEHLDLNTPVPAAVPDPEPSLLDDSTIENTVDDETTGSEEKEVENIDESSNKIDDVETTNKKEEKSTKLADKKSTANDSRRVSRNRNQNVLQEAVTSILENSRPKRNQLRPSYKEDENFDFDMEFPEEVSADDKLEISRSKRDKNNSSAIELEQSDVEKPASGKRSKQTSRSRRDKSNVSVTEAEISDVEKDVTTGKQRGRKSQSKKKSEKTEKDDTLEFDPPDEKPVEEKAIDESEQTDVSDLKIDLYEKSIGQSIEDKVMEEQTIVPPKKKRGRKPKQQVQAEKESSVVDNTPIENAEITVEEPKSKTEVAVPIPDELVIPNQKQQKSKKNQNKRKRKKEATRESDDDECEADNAEPINSKEEQEDDGEKFKASILLESTLETTTNTDMTEISIPARTDPSDDAHCAPVPKATDGSKAQEETKTDLTTSLLGGFDSDDNSLGTDMSVDIQKLLDDPEMATEIAKQPDEDSQIAELPNGIAPVDAGLNMKEPELSVTSATAKDKEDTREIATEVASKRSPKTVRSVEKKGKRRGRKAKSRASSPSEASCLEDEEERRKSDKVQKSKNKIVKSVFGRVFAEKVDKVREVLDDWQSRSENDSSDSEASERSSARRSRSRPKKKSLRARKSHEASSRSRQSKRRAEELISRAFNDSPPAEDERLRQSRRHHRAASPVPETAEEDDQQPAEGKSSRRKKSVARSPEPEVKLDVDDDDEEEEEEDDGPLPEKFGESSMDKPPSELAANEEAPAAYSSDELRPSSSSDAESAAQQQQSRRKWRKSRRARKSASRLLAASSQDEEADGPTEVVTIGPTDALEDNALDLEMPAAEKPRPATKVLNFDEELFVECCSRLKATSEKELRGAKKIKLDHSGEQTAAGTFHHHHRRDEPVTGYRAKDRWRDVESQNSLGSLLESVNQLLGEEYNSREKEYATSRRSHHHHHRHHHHGHHHHHHHHGHHHHHHHQHGRHGNASRSPSPQGVLEARTAVEDGQLGYDDSLDVAFEHNNKLRDKIQQRMRESESLIGTSFGHKHASPAPGAEAGSLGYHGYDYEAGMHSKPRVNNGLGGLLDKALSNLLHHNEKHDHNGSTPMNLLAELACARAPTSTTPTVPEKMTKSSPPHRELVASTEDYKQPHEHHHHHHHHHHHESKSSSPKKSKNPIKELFERKKELHEKRQVEKVKTGAAKSTERSRKQKKAKSGQHSIPLIRTAQYRGGMVERKKRRDSGFKKEQVRQDKNVIKDVYDFDEEESASESPFTSVLSYRAKTDSDKGLNMSALLSKTIGDTLTNGKSISAMGQNLESMVDRKFKDIEKLAPKSIPKTPTADDKSNQQNIIGPMDEFVERRQKSKRSSGEHSTGKHSGKSKKKSGKGAKKKSRNAWYEDDSSDEFVTKLKADDIGVGISKSQRTCSKGKQNLFAEMSSTSSESEFEREVDNSELSHFEPSKLVIATEPPVTDVTENLDEQPKDKESLINDESQNAESQEDWPPRTNDLVESRSNSPHLDLDNAKKSESEELSDHPLVIDENEKDPTDEQRTNSDDETERRTFELDDLYREDSSIVDSDRDELSVAVEDKSNSLLKLPESSPSAQEKKASPDKNNTIEKYITLEDALELLDPPENESSPVLQKKAKSSEDVEPAILESDSQKNSGHALESSRDEEEITLPDLPEKLSGNEKPKRESENLPLHVFLSRKVQESKKRKQQQELKKLMEEQERIMLDLQPTRRQRKCAIGKQGLLAEISSSDDEVSTPHNRRSGDKMDKGEKSRSKQRQRESKEKRKERYIEKKHEQMIAKEQKAIEEAIMRELEEKRLSAASEASGSEKDEQKLPPTELPGEDQDKMSSSRHGKTTPAKHAHKQKSHEKLDELDNSLKRPKSATRITTDTENDELNTSVEMPTPKKKRAPAKSPQKAKKKPDTKTPSETKKTRQTPGSGAQQRRSKSRATSASRGKDAKEAQPRSSSGRHESDLDGDEELKAAKSWNRLDEGVGVAIGRRKRAAANQLYYWSSSSDDEAELAVSVTASATTAADSQDGQEDDRQEQHGWIVGDSHKKMITMLAMEKQMKDKRRRSENDEQSPDGVVGASGNGGKGKSKKHRNSTS